MRMEDIFLIAELSSSSSIEYIVIEDHKSWIKTASRGIFYYQLPVC